MCHSFYIPQSLPHFKGLKQEQMENILDRFDAREEMAQGETVLNQGDLVRGSAALWKGVPVCQGAQPDPSEHQSKRERSLHLVRSCQVSCSVYCVDSGSSMRCWACDTGVTR
jgi:hypothetical protein